MGVILKDNFKSNDLGSFSKIPNLKQRSSLLIFTGLLNFSPIYPFVYLVPILVSTALLICMENTFWNISTDFNFVDLFETSFTLYVESGTRKKVEAAIDLLGNGQGGYLVTKDFREKFCKIIVEHYLCKFYCFYLYLIHLTSNTDYLGALDLD